MKKLHIDHFTVQMEIIQYLWILYHTNRKLYSIKDEYNTTQMEIIKIQYILQILFQIC